MTSKSVCIYVIHYKPFSYHLEGKVLKPFVVGVDDADGGEPWKESRAEMRCHLWAARKAEIPDWIGFQHYRRIFLFQPRINLEAPRTLRVISEELNRQIGAQRMEVPREAFLGYVDFIENMDWGWLEHWDMVIPRPLFFGGCLGDQYKAAHRPEDWDIFEALVVEKGYDPSLQFLTAFNMFMMRDSLFWMFSKEWEQICKEIEIMIVPPKDGYQLRVHGYLAERFFTMWVHKMRTEIPDLRILTLPVLFSENV